MAYELTTLEKFSIYSDVIGTFLIAFAVYTDYWVEVTFSRILPMKESPLHGHYGLMLVCYRTCNFINPIEGKTSKQIFQKKNILFICVDTEVKTICCHHTDIPVILVLSRGLKLSHKLKSIL